ncbi:MAG: polyprenyl synthetase family protein [candidate division Zixibacteria bacterium]|nr:polyprenyl synthetase family protein [candidate division Zixibacteria bacterium]
MFAAACESGSLLSGTDRWASRFRQFGESVGLGFQIADDLLDYVGDQSLTGKPVGNDLREGKVTLPLIFALKHGPESERRHILEHISNGHAESSLSEVVGFVERYGGFAYARGRAEEYCARALEIIKDAGDSDHKLALEAVVNHVVSRQS